MDRRGAEENKLSNSLNLINLIGPRDSSTTNGSKTVNERLNMERRKAFETLEKANKSIKTDVKKIIQQNFIKKDYLKVPTPKTSLQHSSSKLNRTEYVPYHRPKSINISDLITDESINIDLESQTSINNTGVSFDPTEITGRSTHCSENKTEKEKNSSKKHMATTYSRLSVGDILATSLAPKARNLGGVLERASVSSTTLSSLSSSNALLRTADMSLNQSQSTFSKPNNGQFSLTSMRINSNEFQPAENMQSKLLMDEIAWAQEYATIPTATLSKGGKGNFNHSNDFDVHSNPNRSLFERDPNFSMGRFFNQRSEDLHNIVGSLSPERLRAPIALVDDTQSSVSLSTPIGNRKTIEIISDVDITPQIVNRTYSKAPSVQHTSLSSYEKQKGDEHESKDSGNGTKEEDSYFLTLSQIKRAFIKNIDEDIATPALTDLLKKPKKSKSPQNRKQHTDNDTVTKNQSISPKEQPITASIRQSVEQYTNSLNTLDELISENKENWDPQKMRGNQSQADTMSFTESLLNASDFKELQRSQSQTRSPLSPLNIATMHLTPEGIDANIDNEENSAKLIAGTDRQKTSPTSTKSAQGYIKPLHISGGLNVEHVESKSPSTQRTNSFNPKNENPKTESNSSSSLSPTLPTQQKPLSSTRFDDQKYGECDIIAISPNLHKSFSSSKSNTAEHTLLPQRQQGSPYSSISSGLASPPRTDALRRWCENCSPQMPHGATKTVPRMPSSPLMASEISEKSAPAPQRTVSATSLRSGCGYGGGVVRSISRCSSTSEFSHRDGNAIPIKVTAVELCWGSTRLRNAAHKSMQVKNTANKKLTLRVNVHGPGYQLINMPGNNTLTLQSQECRTIAVSFCPTVLGAAIGKLSFYAPQNVSVAHNSAATSSMSSFLDIPLYGYGGHCSIVAQDVHIAPVGMTFIQMGYLHELSQPIQRTIRIYNKGPLLGFVLASIDSVGLLLPRLYTAFEIQPSAMLIPSGTSATLRVIFRPQREDVRKITRQTKSVLTLANLRLISGDEANRQRMRQLVNRMSAEERANISSSKTLEALWEQLRGEKVIEDLQMFKESPELTFNLLTHIRVHEVALTINDDYLDETIKSTSSFCFPDEDETVLFRTVCSPSPSNADGLGQALDRVDEISEVDVADRAHNSSEDNSSSRSETCWSVAPASLNFSLTGEKRKLSSTLLIRNFFKSRQYFEVNTNHKHLLRSMPSAGYAEPEGGHLEVEVNFLWDKLMMDNIREPLHVMVSMENERIMVPVNLCQVAASSTKRA